MTQSTLRVTLVQADLAWHEPEINRQKLQRLLADVAGRTDLVVLPEMFTTGFTMSPQSVAEPADGPTLAWMRTLAARLQAVVTGSIATRDGDGYFNRLVWMRSDGTHAAYDKRHLFRMAHEDQHYRPGTRQLVVELRGFRICPLVCYDLRFPVWSRNRLGTERGYDVLLYVANWPESRRRAWQTLLQARAIENLCYCIGVNRVGVDGTGITYRGDSTVNDFHGQPMAPVSEHESVHTTTLDYAALQNFRSRFPAHLDADRFDLQVESST